MKCCKENVQIPALSNGIGVNFLLASTHMFTSTENVNTQMWSHVFPCTESTRASPKLLRLLGCPKVTRTAGIHGGEKKINLISAIFRASRSSNGKPLVFASPVWREGVRTSILIPISAGKNVPSAFISGGEQHLPS